MNKEELKTHRHRLLNIYLEHDIAGFREFLRDRGIADYATKTDDEVSALMYEMKSQLMYLGPAWQEARNVLRCKQFAYETNIDTLPICATCEYFRTPPVGEEHACMHLGSTPADISCPGYRPLSAQN